MIKIEWKQDTGKYASGSLCYVGPYCVARTTRGFGNKSEPNAKLWQGMSYLPNISIAPGLNHFTNEADAKQVVELVVQKWFDKVQPSYIRTPNKGEKE